MSRLSYLDRDAVRQPSRPGAVRASLIFGWRARVKITRVPAQLFDIAVHPVVFTLMFSYLFGGAVSGSTRSYLTSVAPGILVMTLLVTTGTTGSALSLDIGKGVFDLFRTLPVWRAAALVGALLGDLIRYTAASVVVVGLAVALGFRPAGGIPGVLLGVLLTLALCFSLSWAWIALALSLNTPGAVLGLTQALTYPLALFSNIFVDPSTLPSWLQTFVKVNPVSHLVTAVRSLMAGSADAAQIGWVLAASAILILVFAPIAVRRYRTT